MGCRGRLPAALLLAGVCGIAAASTDVIGPVYPIAEQDFVSWAKAHMASRFSKARLAQLRAEKEKVMHEYAEHPPALSIPRTSKPASHWFDPSITVPYDLRDADGHLIYPAGTTINPLQWRSLTETLLFFDGTDKEQVAWAKRYATGHKGRVKDILVAGGPLELMRAWHKPVFFDQRGLLVHRLGIRHVPAIVYQNGERLRIDEVTP